MPTIPNAKIHADETAKTGAAGAAGAARREPLTAASAKRVGPGAAEQVQALISYLEHEAQPMIVLDPDYNSLGSSHSGWLEGAPMTLSKREFLQVLGAASAAGLGLGRSGETIKTILEDVADILFNPDPYYQQDGDMVRVGGLAYTCQPAENMGRRITGLRLGGKPIEAGRRYKVAGWAPVAEEARTAPGSKPVWDIVEGWLKSQPGGHVKVRDINTPALVGVQGNPGIARG